MTLLLMNKLTYETLPSFYCKMHFSCIQIFWFETRVVEAWGFKLTVNPKIVLEAYHYPKNDIVCQILRKGLIFFSNVSRNFGFLNHLNHNSNISVTTFFNRERSQPSTVHQHPKKRTKSFSRVGPNFSSI